MAIKVGLLVEVVEVLTPQERYDHNLQVDVEVVVLVFPQKNQQEVQILNFMHLILPHYQILEAAELQGKGE